jgi:hypothetical protein
MQVTIVRSLRPRFSRAVPQEPRRRGALFFGVVNPILNRSFEDALLMFASPLNHRLLACRQDSSSGSGGRELLHLTEECRILAEQSFVRGVIDFKGDRLP